MRVRRVGRWSAMLVPLVTCGWHSAREPSPPILHRWVHGFCTGPQCGVVQNPLNPDVKSEAKNLKSVPLGCCVLPLFSATAEHSIDAPE